MKPITKTFILSGLLAMLALASCKKSESYMNNAVVAGLDERQTVCAGTFWVNIFNNADPSSFVTYDCNNTPASLGMNGNTVLPVYLKVNWKEDGSCGAPKIIITSYTSN